MFHLKAPLVSVFIYSILFTFLCFKNHPHCHLNMTPKLWRPDVGKWKAVVVCAAGGGQGRSSQQLPPVGVTPDVPAVPFQVESSQDFLLVFSRSTTRTRTTKAKAVSIDFQAEPWVCCGEQSSGLGRTDPVAGGGDTGLGQGCGVMGLGVGTAGWPWGQLDPAPSREVVRKPDGETWGHGEWCQAVPLTLQGASPPVPMSPDRAVAQGVLVCPWTGSCRLSEPTGAGGTLDKPALLPEPECGG